MSTPADELDRLAARIDQGDELASSDRALIAMTLKAVAKEARTARPEAAGFGWVKVSDRMPDRETFCLWRGEDAKGYWYAMEYPGDFPPPISMRGQADSWIPLPWKPEALRSPLAHKE